MKSYSVLRQMGTTSLFLALILLLSFAVAVASAQTTATEETKTTDDTRFLNCGFDAEDADDCDADAYATRIINYTLPGTIFGAILIIICPFFHCCHCCGCCGCGKQVPRSSWDVVRGKLYALGMFVLLTCLSILYGNVSAGKLRTALLGLADATESVPDVIGRELDLIEEALTVQKYNATTDQFYTDNLFAGTTLAEEGNTTQQDLADSTDGSLDDFRAAVEEFDFILFVLFSVPCVVAAFGLLAALCNVRNCLPMVVAFFFFLFGAALFVLFGVFSGLGLVIEDICTEVRGVVAQLQTILLPLTGCKDSDFVSFTDAFADIESEVAKATCESLEAQCYNPSSTVDDNLEAGRTYDCSVGIDCTAPAFADIVDLLDAVFIHAEVKARSGAISEGQTCRDTSLQCTITECGSNCQLDDGSRSERGRLSLELATEFSAAASVSSALETLGGRYGSCIAIYGVILGAFDGTCQDLVSAGTDVRNAYGSSAMFVVFGIVVMIMGATRFMSFEEAAESRVVKQPPGYGTEITPAA